MTQTTHEGWPYFTATPAGQPIMTVMRQYKPSRHLLCEANDFTVYIGMDGVEGQTQLSSGN